MVIFVMPRPGRRATLAVWAKPGWRSDAALSSRVWPGRERAPSPSHSRKRPVCPSSTSTSPSGSQAGSHRRRPSGARSSASCSLATRGSLMATTTRHSISGSNARTPWWSSTCPGGSVQDARSGAGSRCRANFLKDATTRPGPGCAMSGAWPVESGASETRNPHASARSSREHGQNVAVHVLRSKRAVTDFLYGAHADRSVVDDG